MHLDTKGNRPRSDPEYVGISYTRSTSQESMQCCPLEIRYFLESKKRATELCHIAKVTIRSKGSTRWNKIPTFRREKEEYNFVERELRSTKA